MKKDGQTTNVRTETVGGLEFFILPVCIATGYSCKFVETRYDTYG